MREIDIERRSANTGARVIQSGAQGMFYLVHDNDRRIAIAGEAGITIVTVKQAEVLARELPEILQVYGR